MKNYLSDLQQFTPPHWVKTLFKGALIMSAAIISYQSATAQTLYSAVNAETQMINGPYANIKNTGNYIAPCSQCPNDYMHVMTWDGDDPAVSFSDGNVTIVAALPSNINDPDIVVGLDGRVAMVAYVTSSGNLEYKLYTVTLPLTWSTTPTISSATTVATSARHPNLDLNTIDTIAIVWNMPNSTGTNPDVQYNVGTLTSTGVNWNTSGPFQADNKMLNILKPQQNGDCLRPDIAIGGATGLGVHITFLEANSGVYDWWKMDDDFGINGQNWHSSFTTSTPGSKYSAPRISASRGLFDEDWFVAVLADIDTTTNNEHVRAVNNVTGSYINAEAMMFPTGTYLDPVVAWVDDEYVNVAWAMNDNNLTTDFDIAVKRLDHTGQAQDYTWAIANQSISGKQYLPSIAGAGIGLPYGNPGQFAYMWVDDEDEIWHKVVPAPDNQLKQEIAFEGQYEISVYPVPTTFGLTIKLSEAPVEASYIVSDLVGKKIFEGTLTNSVNELNVSSLPLGIFLLNVKNNSKEFTQRIIKY